MIIKIYNNFMSNNLKKIIIILLVSVFSLLILIKYSVAIVKNEVLSMIKSPTFDRFIVNIVNEKLEKIAETELTQDQKVFYSSKLKKIIQKFEVD